VTDARLLAQHLEWAATDPLAKNQVLNVVNGDVFRWNWMWGRLASWFGIKAAPFDGKINRLTEQMANAQTVWAKIVAKHGLIETDLARIASFWHTDADLNRPFECITDMSKSRILGFTAYRSSEQSFFDVFARMRANHIVP